MADTDKRRQAADALRHLALNEEAKKYILDRPRLYEAGLRAAQRFIGGETLDECIQEAKAIDRGGHLVSIDFMGESTRARKMAQDATEEFVRIARAIDRHEIEASVSLDLSHVGMVIDEDLCLENANRIAEAACEANTEMMISMEGADRTDTVLRLHQRLCERFDNVGVTLQAYLRRTPDDLTTVMERPGKIRLVKGAFATPEHLTVERRECLLARYRELTGRLVSAGYPCSIATHDEHLLDSICQLVRDKFRSDGAVEFEMLKGVTTERLDALRTAGYQTRVYLPYGREWFLYICNRLAEHPPNLYQAISDAVGDA